MPTYESEEIYRQTEEALGGTEVDFRHKGEKFPFPHPAFQDDAWLEGLENAGPGAEGNARYLLGDEPYERYIAAGGHPLTVMRTLGLVNEASVDAMSDGTPTRSGISSVSSRKRSRRR